MPMLRPFALTMPAVAVNVRPMGLPSASTQSPTRSWSESPNWMTGSVSRPSGSTRITATSVLGSAPITSAVYSRPSSSTTFTFSAFRTTW
jgi:hypothetical protein